jgi:hypothetical protein
VIVYSISSRQFSSLRDGLALQIALPVDPAALVAGCDLARWSASRLPHQRSEWIRAAVRQSIWCHATNRGGGDGSPAATWGEIIDADKLSRIDAISISAVVVTLSHVSAPVSTRLTRWPGGKIEILKKL